MPPRQKVVWGFPIGFNPNTTTAEVRCDVCRRKDAWTGRVIPELNIIAWTCSACPQPGQPPQIPD